MVFASHNKDAASWRGCWAPLPCPTASRSSTDDGCPQAKPSVRQWRQLRRATLTEGGWDGLRIEWGDGRKKRGGGLLTLAFWQTGSGEQDVSELDASGLQPPKQNCVRGTSDVSEKWKTAFFQGMGALTLPVPQKPNSPVA